MRAGRTRASHPLVSIHGRTAWWLGRGASIWLLALFGVAACREDSGRRAPTAHPQPPAVGSIEIEEVLRIGTLAGPEATSFGMVAGVVPAPNGGWYVADALAHEIRRFDEAGTPVATVGRRGEGPGEFQAINGIGATDAGTLIVWDGANGRLTFFDDGGAVDSTLRVPGGYGDPESLVVNPSGEVYVVVAPSRRDGIPAGRADWVRIVNGSFNWQASTPFPDFEGVKYALSGAGGYYRPFTRETLWALDVRGRLYVARNDEYRIRISELGKHIGDRGRSDVEVVRVSAEEKDQWEVISRYMERRAAELPFDVDTSYPPIPDTKPFLRAIRVDLDERLWVSRYTPTIYRPYDALERQDRMERDKEFDYVWRDLPLWDVFSANGEYLGDIVLPFNTSLYGSRGSLLWGVQDGPLREPYVVVWRMRIDADL